MTASSSDIQISHQREISINSPARLSKSVDLSKLVVDQVRTWFVFDSDEAGLTARQMLETIQRNEIRLAEQAVMFGCYLAQCRASIDRGQWLPWLEVHFGSSRSTAYRYLALAEHFSRSQKLLLPELQDITSLVLGGQTDKASSAREKLVAFVRDQSLQELYRRYQVMAPKGGKTYERDGTKGRRLTPQEQQDADAEGDAAIWRDRLRNWRNILDRVTDEDGWRHLKPEEQEELRCILLDLSHRISAHQRGESIR
jgi:hypothetical protein